MIGILDLNLGNLRSVANSIYEMGFDYLLISNKNQMAEVTHLIIPGVGYFPRAISNLIHADLMDATIEFRESGRPILGICLGMQLFATLSYEGGETKGLNFIPGFVQRFKAPQALRIPHIGWNTVHFQQSHPIFEGIKDKRDFYFVHSYHYSCENQGHVFGATEYGALFPSIIIENQVIGFQFHPEKSQKNGLALLENFCRWDGLC